MIKHQSGMQFLGFFEEAIGKLNELTEDEEVLNARIGEVVLVLPPEMKNRLLPLLAMCVGILHTDIPGKEYLFRVLPTANHEMESAALRRYELCRLDVADINTESGGD